MRSTLFIRNHLINFATNHPSFRSEPNAYAEVIDIYARDRAIQLGKKLHAHLIIKGFAHFTVIASKLIALYIECGTFSLARKLFDKIPVTNVRRWIALIGTSTRCGFHEEALGVFSEMQTEGLKPNVFVIPSILKACGHLCNLRTGEKIHGIILKCSFQLDAFVSSALIDMYSKCTRIEKARRVFDEMLVKDLVSVNAIVSGYAQQGLAKDALMVVESMRALGIKPNVVTWNSLISGFSQKGDPAMGSKLFKMMIADGVQPDVISWTSVISGLVQNFRCEEAFDVFKQMLDDGFCPTSATISTLLPACASAAKVRRGRELHSYALVIGVGEDIYVRSAMVDMYSKCGFIYEARTIFHQMPVKNTVTFNSMIFGYANHGYCDEAIELFRVMEKESRGKLDHLTFTAVLTACCHAGDIELGQSLFKIMQERYKIEPRLEHYACMVDLFGRAGKLDEAFTMIKAMPIEPDLFVWGALLAACRNHGREDLAEVAANHLSELEPESVGNRLLLSSLYADAGKWGKVERLKRMLKKRKLRKFPGCSWIDRKGFLKNGFGFRNSSVSTAGITGGNKGFSGINGNGFLTKGNGFGIKGLGNGFFTKGIGFRTKGLGNGFFTKGIGFGTKGLGNGFLTKGIGFGTKGLGNGFLTKGIGLGNGFFTNGIGFGTKGLGKGFFTKGIGLTKGLVNGFLTKGIGFGIKGLGNNGFFTKGIGFGIKGLGNGFFTKGIGLRNGFFTSGIGNGFSSAIGIGFGIIGFLTIGMNGFFNMGFGGNNGFTIIGLTMGSGFLKNGFLNMGFGGRNPLNFSSPS
ncbi:pentatricopeptide repeat-containing protein [Senna tora]|uniref:Pentatricopeptide repeat-containing protein n=1 Tax=Senna tora TaxID=362788 RepID=A0A834WPJ0_9FABA|nr:pentatricopeptide repeat-containing protein [Senna tora]